MSGKLVMGYWDCPFCHTKGILGTSQDCPNCGATRGKDVKFYMKKGEVTYLTEEQSKTKGQGADWMCSWCRSYNSALNTKCKNCGAPREDQSFDYNERQGYNANQEENNYKNSVSSNQNYYDNFNNNKKNVNDFWSKHLGLSALVALFLAIFIIGSLLAVIGYLITPHSKTLTVSDVSWKYNIEIEKYKEVAEDDWSLPEGANLKYSQQEIHHYDKQLDHYETVTKTRKVQDGYDVTTSYSDNGDGTFTEHEHRTPRYKTETYTEEEPVYKDVPIYREKYYYTIWKWVHERDVTTEAHDKSPYWGEVNLEESEREGKRTETYIVSAFKCKKDKPKDYKTTREIWEQLNVDTSRKMLVRNKEILELE